MNDYEWYLWITTYFSIRIVLLVVMGISPELNYASGHQYLVRYSASIDENPFSRGQRYRCPYTVALLNTVI